MLFVHPHVRRRLVFAMHTKGCIHAGAAICEFIRRLGLWFVGKCTGQKLLRLGQFCCKTVRSIIELTILRRCGQLRG